MATSLLNESEDLMTSLTCGVCLNQYDLENRKPKSLQCKHTICLSCAQVTTHCSSYSYSVSFRKKEKKVHRSLQSILI